MKKTILIMTSFMFCLMSYVLSAEAIVVVDYNTADYYPLLVGSHWTYDITGTDFDGSPFSDTETEVITAFESVDYSGTIYTGYKRMVNTEYSIENFLSNGLNMIKFGDDASGDYSLFGNEFSLSPTAPWPVVPASWAFGDSFSISYKEYEYNSAGVLQDEVFHGLTSELIGLESVTVSAGVFNDAIKMTMSQTGVGFSQITELYLAENVGVIKEVINQTMGTQTRSYTAELTNFNIAPEPISTLLFLVGGVPMGFGLWRRKR